MSFQIFNNKKLINKNLQSNLSRTVIIYTVNSNKSVWSVYKLCQGIHHPPETERWQSAERNKMAAVEQKKLGNISCKLQQFFLWNVGYLFNVKKNKKKTGGWTWSVWFAQAWHRFISSSLRSVPCFLGLFFLGLFFFFRQCMKASTCESLCVMESHNGSIITLKPRRAECDCKMCVCKCVCVHVFMCVFVGTCYGDYTVRGLCWCAEIHSDTALLHDGNALYVLHLSQKGQADDIHMHHEWKSAETRTNTSEKWRGRDCERRKARGWGDREGNGRLIDGKDALSPPAMLTVLLGTGF